MIWPFSWFRDKILISKVRSMDRVPQRALCVGICNYPDPRNRLHGCIKDANNWKSLLTDIGFPDPVLLIDSMATKSNVTNILKDMTSRAIPGDSLVFTYSGHGTSVPDEEKDEPDGRDEAICLYDDVLVDDDLADILAMAPEGVRITIVLDSCHSGTMTRGFVPQGCQQDKIVKYLPPEDERFAKKVRDTKIASRMLTPHLEVPMWEVLLSGCKDSEYSYDTIMEGKPCGAFTYHATKLIRDNPGLTYGQFATMIREMLPSNEYPQTPQVECDPSNNNKAMFT
jgi:metacaspase-1